MIMKAAASVICNERFKTTTSNDLYTRPTAALSRRKTESEQSERRDLQSAGWLCWAGRVYATTSADTTFAS